MGWLKDSMARRIRKRGHLAATTAVTAAVPSQGHPHVQAIRYLVVSEACDAALAAIARHDMKRAALLGEHALSLDVAHPEAIRVQALLAMHRGEPDTAVEWLERAGSSLGSMRLLLQLARLQAGQREAAHLELHAWARLDSCPPQARQLLAYLEHQAGDDTSARLVLQRNLRHQLEPASLQMLWLIDRQDGLCDSAKRSAAVMAHRLSHHEPTRAFERLMGMGDRVPTQVPVEMIEQLAGELLEQPDVIVTLVAAQKNRMQSQRVELLRRSLRRIVEDVPQPLEAIVALAELAMLADDADDAKRWALRGLSRSDPTTKLWRLYRPSVLTRLVYPLAAWRYRGPLRDPSCDHSGCDCVWCEHGTHGAVGIVT